MIITHIITIKYLVKGQRSKKGKIYKYSVKDRRKECTLSFKHICIQSKKRSVEYT